MLKNTGKLAGKTLFITGASRGIGKAIALKAAQDGANIVIAAKTTEPHPILPGTIYTAAKEVEEAGGKCLPCAVDIRDENAVNSAVQEAVKTFGGIDILVNNASAISLTGTLETPMKKYDLMNNVNVRGTFLCSKACIPYLKNAENPHILNVTPPLNIRHAWFKEHVAYSLSKYGMSLCVLGMSQEFKDDGIAVNALWPKKGIATVAVMVTAGKQGLAYCRIDKFFADAAYIMLTRDSKARTGEFLYDEDVLKEAGITDFEQYSYIPAGAPVPDSFIDGYSPTLQRNSSKDIRETSSHRSQVRGVVDIFDAVKNFLDEKLVRKVNAVFEFHLTGKEAGVWYLDLKSSTGEVGRGSFSGDEVNSTVMLDSEDFVKLFTGELNPAQAYLGGKLQLTGSMHKFMKLENQLLQKMKSKL